jgi:hypothetical protein
LIEILLILLAIGAALAWLFGFRRAMASRAREADAPYLKDRLRRPGVKVISVRYRGQHGGTPIHAPVFRDYAVMAERHDGHTFRTTASVQLSFSKAPPFKLADQAGFDAFAGEAKRA